MAAWGSPKKKTASVLAVRKGRRPVFFPRGKPSLLVNETGGQREKIDLPKRATPRAKGREKMREVLQKKSHINRSGKRILNQEENGTGGDPASGREKK